MPEQSWKQHLGEELLEQYSLGRLPETEVETAEEHLLVCEACQTRLAALDEYHKAMRAGLDRIVHEPTTQRASARWRSSGMYVALAAGVVLLLLGVPAMQRSGAPQMLELSATRSSQTDTAGSDRPLDLRLSAMGLETAADVQIEVVDTSGRRQWSGPSKLDGATWNVRIDPLERGSYWIRVYGTGAQPGADPLREYALVVN